MSRYRTRSWRAFEPPAAPFTAPPRTTPPETALLLAAVSVRVLGLDPGSRRTGYAVIECRGHALAVLSHGCLDVGAESPAARLRRIFEGLRELISRHRPAEVAIERVFVSRNADSALKLG
jgi:hypothetical protein